MLKSKVAIIGAGPAGCSAAIQLRRFGIDLILIEKKDAGGLIVNANLIENYLGFHKGIKGEKFVSLLKEHLAKLGIEVTKDEISNVNFENNNFILNGFQNTYSSEFLILATGTNPIEFEDFEIPEKLKDKIFYEIADIPDKNHKNVTLIGSGDAAFDYSLNLTGHNSIVDIFIRSQKAKALNLLIERAMNNPNITIHYSHKFINITENNEKLISNFEHKNNQINVVSDYLLFALGRKPNNNYISIDETTQQDLSFKEKLFFVGDIINGNCRQAVIAAGNGTEAAMKIFNKINR